MESNRTSTPKDQPTSTCPTVTTDALEASFLRLQNNLQTMADRMQNLVRALNENMFDEVAPQRPKPLDIKKIRCLKWAKGKGETCLICHESMPLKAKKLQCGHKFHPQCIIPWLKITASCPKCRQTVS